MEEKKLQLEGGDVFEGRAIGELPMSGTVKHKNGDVFIGTFLDGLRHGHGKLQFANGDVFECCHVHGAAVGQGRLRCLAEATVFTGRFGRPLGPDEDEPDDLIETLLYRGLSSAEGL